MELSVRDWMVIIGALLILAVLLDGYRRMRRDPKRVKLALTEVPDGPDDDIAALRELPNGGARTVHRDDELFSVDPGQDEASPVMAGFSATEQPDPGENMSLLDGLDGERENASAEPENTEQQPQEVVLLHVVSREEAGFRGEDILHILLACDLRFGEMDFFHRYDRAAGKGKKVFSVANMLQPGVFDIDAMSNFSTQGLIFFLTLPGPMDMMKSFDLMLESARRVAEHLEGDLLDESRSVATRQTLDHIRQRIRDFERRLLTQAR